ncbi:hypothetical protein FALCPG4_013894 [Fusarium falciforme]
MTSHPPRNQRARTPKPPPDPPASTPTVLADGDLQMSTLVDSCGRVMAVGFRNVQGGSNVNVVAPVSNVFAGCFAFQGGRVTPMVLAYQEEPQSAAQASPNAGPDGGQATGQEEQSGEAAGTPSTEEPAEKATAPGEGTHPEQQG